MRILHMPFTPHARPHACMQMSAVLKEREQIARAIGEVVHRRPSGAHEPCNMRPGERYVELFELMQALAASVHKERGARDTVIQFIGYGAFDPPTNAALMARSYP